MTNAADTTSEIVRTFAVGKFEYVVERFKTCTYVNVVVRGISHVIGLSPDTAGDFCVLSCRPALQAGGKPRWFASLAEVELKCPAFRGAGLVELAKEFPAVA